MDKVVTAVTGRYVIVPVNVNILSYILAASSIFLGKLCKFFALCWCILT